jgi:predicted dehydrogenase
MKLAVLGCGSIGRRHLRNLLALGESEIVAFDPVVETCRNIEKELGIAAHTTIEEIWKCEPYAVLVTAPSNLHIPLALEAARRGCHLFIEKPLSASTEGLSQLGAEIAKSNLITMVGCNMRFHPGPAGVKALLDQRKIGQVLSARIECGSYLPRWRPPQDYRESYSASSQWGGAILDCIHEIDLALWHFGPASLIASAKLPATSLGLETDGLAEILLHHTSGTLTSVHLNFIQRDYRRGCRIIGTTGTIYWDYSRRVTDIFDEDGILEETISEPSGWEPNQMYRDELKHFLHAVSTRQQTVNPISGSIAALEIALAVRNS